MEFFHQPNYDWMGKAKYFVSLSLIFASGGVVAGIWRHGLTYGIDFKGGTLVDVRFAQNPDMWIRSARICKARGWAGVTIVPIHDISHPNANEVEIDLPEQSQDEQTALDAGQDANRDGVAAELSERRKRTNRISTPPPREI